MRFIFLLGIFLTLWAFVSGRESMDLTDENFKTAINSAKLVNVNFYVNWCHFSRMLAPVWEETSRQLDSNNDILFASVDCDKQPTLCGTFKVNKYPTMKTFIDGILLKREYRRERSIESIKSYTLKLLESAVHQVSSVAEYMDAVKEHTNIITVVVDSLNSPAVSKLANLSKLFRDECYFVVSDSEAVKDILGLGPKERTDVFVYKSLHQKVILHPLEEPEEEVTKKVKEFCDPLVRKLSFDRAEEYTERGLPFFILFHDPNDIDSVEKFYRQLNENFLDQKNNYLFLTADGHEFSHPLHHIGRTESELPVIALDSFKHMYKLEFEDFMNVETLKNFFADFVSDALHQRWHQNEHQMLQQQIQAHQRAAGHGHGAAHIEQVKRIEEEPKSPGNDFKPSESVPKIHPVGDSSFVKLEPRANRYSFRYNNHRDEL